MTTSYAAEKGNIDMHSSHELQEGCGSPVGLAVKDEVAEGVLVGVPGSSNECRTTARIPVLADLRFLPPTQRGETEGICRSKTETRGLIRQQPIHIV